MRTYIILALSLLLSVPLPACKKDSTVSDSALAASVPPGTAIVVSLSVERLRAAPMWPQLSETLRRQADLPFAEAKELCGVDLLQAVDRVTLFSDAAVHGESAAIMVDGFARAEVADCAAKLAQAEGGSLSVEDDGRITAYAAADAPEAIYAAWLDDDSLIAMPGVAENKTALASLIEKSSGSDEPVRKLLAKTDPARTLVAAAHIVPGSELASMMAMTGATPQGVWLSVDYGAIFNATMGLRYADADQAKAAAANLRTQLLTLKSEAPIGGDLIGAVQVTETARDVIVSAMLDEAQTKQLNGLVQTFARF